MLKKLGDPCPKCAGKLLARRSTFRAIEGDIAYCARCDAAYELAREDEPQIIFPAPSPMRA